MGDIHLLAGAMGIASWRARTALEEYRLSAAMGVSLHKEAGSAVTKAPQSWTLNEVGVTDAVMSSLWRHAPHDRTYAISSRAESAIFGGDLAIVDGAGEIRVFQSKLVKRFDRAAREFVLKSPLTSAHAALLQTRHVTLNNTRYRMSGFLALYQRSLPKDGGRTTPQRSAWWRETATTLNAPALGGVYYWDMMHARSGKLPRLASARGIMAARVPHMIGQHEISRVDATGAWPWEYGIADHWPTGLGASSPGGRSRGASGGRPGPRERSRLDFTPVSLEPLSESQEEMPRAGRAAFASDLFELLYDRETTRRLFIVFV